jgi:hypothetical protein
VLYFEKTKTLRGLKKATKSHFNLTLDRDNYSKTRVGFGAKIGA